MKVATVDEMRALDRYAVEKLGIPEEILMENAGIAAYSVLSKEVGVRGKRFVVFCGVGNNGGDGFVVARKIHSNGGDVKVFILGDRKNFKGAAEMNLNLLSHLPVELHSLTRLESARKDVLHCDAVVDAVFGTGLARPVEGFFKDAIRLINESGKKVLSLDIPSGVSGDTGEVMGEAVRASFTVAFGLPKAGNLLFPGFERCGDLYVSHISFPPSLYDRESLKVEVNLPPPLPPRMRDGHKGDFGEALFIAGAPGYFGAPYYAALSFLKAGGGYSRLAAPLSLVPSIAVKGGEIVFIPLKESVSGGISGKSRKTLLDLAGKMDIVVLGPGLSLEKETQELVRSLVRDIDKPLLIDGDGLTAVAAKPDTIRKRRNETILTPHPGEMARLVGVAASEIEKNRLPILRKAAKDFAAVIVLKGAHTLIGYPDGKVFINLSGNSGMATAGSGDVLTGTIAAMYGLGLSLPDAVRKGVFIHGLSGDIAAAGKGEDGITAQDILDHLPLAVKRDRETCEEHGDSPYGGIRVI